MLIIHGLRAGLATNNSSVFRKRPQNEHEHAQSNPVSSEHFSREQENACLVFSPQRFKFVTITTATVCSSRGAYAVISRQVVCGKEHISFTTSKIGSLADVQAMFWVAHTRLLERCIHWTKLMYFG